MLVTTSRVCSFALAATTALAFVSYSSAAPGQGGPGAGQPGQGNMDPVQIAQRMITEFDRDGDQALNARELATMMQQMRERRGQQGQAGPPGRRGAGQGAGPGRPGRGGAGAGRPQRPN